MIMSPSYVEGVQLDKNKDKRSKMGTIVNQSGTWYARKIGVPASFAYWSHLFCPFFGADFPLGEKLHNTTCHHTGLSH
jgi:hypothetical protein